MIKSNAIRLASDIRDTRKGILYTITEEAGNMSLTHEDLQAISLLLNPIQDDIKQIQIGRAHV